VSDVLNSCKSDPVISIDFGSAPAIANAIANQPGQESKWNTTVVGWASVVDLLQHGRLASRDSSSSTIDGLFVRNSPILAGTGVPRSLPQGHGNPHT
jgi:hypothetical protein